MKANLKNVVGLVALGMSLFASTALTWAGRTAPSEVRIGSNQISQYASGSMVGARYSVDNKQYIYCIAIASTNPTNYPTLCGAGDSTGKYITCGSYDPKLQEVVQAMTDSSSIYFVSDLNNTCTNIVVYHGSDLLK